VQCPKTNRISALALLSLLGVTLALAARAKDWPQWRGLNRDGVWSETGVGETFPTNGLKVRWRAPVGYGYSSPIVAQGRVYVTDSQLDKQPKARERVLCFDEESGKSLWTNSHEVIFPDWAFTPGQEKGPNATPIVENGKVYSLASFGCVFCVEARDGTVLWQKDLAKKYPAAELTASASPLIDGNLLILLVGAKPAACVVALDKNSGKEVWKALDEPAAHSSPIVITTGGCRQLIVWTQKSVTALDPATGKVHWREPLPTMADYIVSTPVFSNGRLLLGGLMLKLDSAKPAASVLWPETRSPSRRILSNTSTALLHSNHVFSATSSGELVCLDASTGQQVWATNKVTGLKTGASIHLTLNGDSVLLFNDRGELIRARLTAQGYHEISRAALIEPTYSFGGRKVAWTPPAYANRHVFARSDKELICASLTAEP
jgi:outer membrane protein assembly factor BamB